MGGEGAFLRQGTDDYLVTIPKIEAAPAVRRKRSC